VSVFDSSIKTPRRVSDPGTDKSLGQGGSLAWPAIASATGLASCTGVDAALIHGDQWDNILGNRQLLITQNWTQTTLGTKTCTVVQNRVTSTVATRNDTTVGATVRTNVGPAAHNYVAPHVASHTSPQNRFEPTAYLHFIFSKLWAGNSLNNIGLLYFQFFAVYTTITPTYFNLTPALNLAVTGINIHFEGLDNGSRALENKLAGMQSKIQGLEAKPQIIEICTEVNINMVSLAVNSVCF